MTSNVMSSVNSHPLPDVSNDVECGLLNFDLVYDAILAHVLCHEQGHSSLTPIYLYCHTVTSDAVCTVTSYPQPEVINDIKILNFYFVYDAILTHVLCHE